jgi:hypothetical protein
VHTKRAHTWPWLAGPWLGLFAAGGCDFHIAPSLIAHEADASSVTQPDGGGSDDAGRHDAGRHDAGSDDAGQDMERDAGVDDEDAGQQGFAFESAYFARDDEALEVAEGRATAKLPSTWLVDNLGLQWRITNALRMLGHEPHAMMTGETIDAARLREIDRALARKETAIRESARRLPDYRANWAPDFEDNIPQEFAVHQVASLFALLNTRGALPPLERFSNECVLANFLPGLCGSLVDTGTSMEGGSCQDPSATLRDPQIVQMSDFFGFNNVRREIAANELPPQTPGLESNCRWASLLAGTFVLEIERSWGSYLDMQFTRADACSDSHVDFYGEHTPFSFTGAPGTQISGDFVSVRAAGFADESLVYRSPIDVVETVTAYMLFPEYLRARAGRSTILQNKYDFVRDTMFGGVEFENPALAGLDFEFASAASAFCWEHELTEFRIEDVRPLP